MNNPVRPYYLWVDSNTHSGNAVLALHSGPQSIGSASCPDCILTYMLEPASYVPPLPPHRTRVRLPRSPLPYVLETAMLGYIQEVSSDNIHVQTRSRPVPGKCPSLIMGMPYGSLSGFLLRIPPKCTRLPGILPRSLILHAFDQETLALFTGAVSIYYFLLVVHWAGGD